MWPKLALLLCLALSASGQDVIASATSGPWTAELNGKGRSHTGDNPQCALPEYGDGNWAIPRLPGEPPLSESYWLQTHVRIGRLADPALLLGPIASTYEVYWDFERIENLGNLSGSGFVPRWQTFPIGSFRARPGNH